MIPPTFHIGDEVLITGPSIMGCKFHIGRRFTIEQIDRDKYSSYGLPYYPASSLRLVNKKPLSLMSITYNYKPDDCEHGTIQVSCPCGRKAEIDPKLNEEPKVGDLVQIVGPDWADVMRSHDPEKAYPIHEKTEAGNFQIIDIGIFPATSLRKLTPEEIKQHIAPKLELDQKTKVKIGMALLKHLDQISEMRDRLAAIEKRLDFVEKFQRGQAEAAQYRRNMYRR